MAGQLEPVVVIRWTKKRESFLDQCLGWKRTDWRPDSGRHVQTSMAPPMGGSGNAGEEHSGRIIGTQSGPWFHHLRHAAFRAWGLVLRVVRDFLRTPAAVFLDFGTALSEAGNSSLGCFAVR